MDMWDLEYAKAGAKKPQRYPRPFGPQRPTEHHGDAAGRSPDEVKTILRNASALLAEGPV